MAAFFAIGEKKVRPGVYYRYENYGTPMVAGAADGVCAAVIRSDWGPVGEAVLVETTTEVTKKFGEGGTTAVPYEMFRGGAKSIYVVRVGSGGAKGSIDLLSTEKDSEDKNKIAAKLTLLYPGAREFQVTIREALDDSTKKELQLVENTSILQTIRFDKDGDETENLLAAYAESGSDYFMLQKAEGGKLETIDQEIITGGQSTTPTVNDYKDGLVALEPYRFNVIAADTDDTDIHAALHEFITRNYETGKLIMGVVGEPTSVRLEDRLTHAKSFNDYKVVYVGGGFKDSSDNTYEGYLAAARVAGMIAGAPSNESITHAVLTGAVELTETLTNAQLIQAINSGMLTFSVSPDGLFWIESGVNTLVVPGAKEDQGWKKIKRTKVRYELMQRINDTVEILIGKINNDPDGRATIIQAAQGVVNSMIAEKKVLSGSRVLLDPDNAPEGDSAWFVIYADDIDALEKMYFTFKFRFAPEEQ